MAMTGASGAPYAVRLLQMLLVAGHHVHLTISPAGATILQTESNLNVDLARFDPAAIRYERWHAAEHPGQLVYHHYSDFMSPIASGSHLTAGMVIAPCSGATLAAIAHGTGANLIHRAAEVHLKERRKFIVVPRETPLSTVALANMLRISELGAVVLPAMPGWYHGVKSTSDLIDFVVARALDQLGVEHRLAARWGETPR